jgi:hypothetical protein
MSSCLFESFARMIDDLPAQAVCKAVRLECQMLSDDLACHRPEPLDEVFSIERFDSFLQTVKERRRMTGTCFLPAEHFGFYKKTVERMIAACQLPSDTMKYFNEAFIAADQHTDDGKHSLRLTTQILPH